MIISITSWPLAANSEIQPVSRWLMMSLWSFQMLMGADTARLPRAITTGRRMAETMGITSPINSSPWELVAVNTRAPMAEAPQQALKAECSDSTQMNSASSLPSATMSERCSGMWVLGVMG
jgi:hypothetical protein